VSGGSRGGGGAGLRRHRRRVQAAAGRHAHRGRAEVLRRSPLSATLAERVRKLREEIRAHRAAGKLIVYASTPISPRGGGDMAVNLEIAASVKPGSRRSTGPRCGCSIPAGTSCPTSTAGRPAGGDYMVMWTEVLGGENGAGRDFDMVHFTGPGDMRGLLRLRPRGRERLRGPASRRTEDRRSRRRQAFIRYYTLRASAAYSTGPTTSGTSSCASTASEASATRWPCSSTAARLASRDGNRDRARLRAAVSGRREERSMRSARWLAALILTWAAAAAPPARAADTLNAYSILARDWARPMRRSSRRRPASR